MNESTEKYIKNKIGYLQQNINQYGNYGMNYNQLILNRN